MTSPRTSKIGASLGAGFDADIDPDVGAEVGNEVGNEVGKLAAIEHLLRAQTLSVVARRHFDPWRQGCAALAARPTTAWMKTAAGGQGCHIGRGTDNRIQCGGKLKIIAAIEEPAAIERIRTHLELCAQPPPRALARRVDLLQAA